MPTVQSQYSLAMRPLTDDETKVLFEKLANYIGKNIEQLINRPDEKYCFRLHKDRVYYVRYWFPRIESTFCCMFDVLLSCAGTNVQQPVSHAHPKIQFQLPSITW